MPFVAGAIIGKALLDTKDWMTGVGKVNKSSASLTGVLGNLAKIGFTAVAAGMTAAIYQANEYQKEFANVSTLTDQNTKALQDMSIGLLSISSELGSTRELTKSMYDAISAGAKPGKEALDTVTAFAKFAKAALADNAASVKLLSATVNAYGRENIESERAADIFFTTIKQGVITGEELSATIGQSIPLFASMNIPVEQLAAGMAAMTKQGVGASEATTQLNAIVNAFLKPSEALAEQLEKVGYQSGQTFIETEGLTGALELLQNATENEGVEVAELLPNIRALRGVLALSGEGAKNYAMTLDEMADATGAVDTAFQKQEKTFKTFQNELGKTAIIAGNIGKHFVDDIAGGAQSALESINEFLLTGDGLIVFSNIAEKVGGAFSVIETFASELYDMFADNLNESIDDLVSLFDELFEGSITQGEVFDVLSETLNVLGGVLNVVIKLVKLFITNMANLTKIAIDSAKVLGDAWQVITGKKQLKDVEESFSVVLDGFKKFGTDYIDGVKEIVEEGQEQWKKLTTGAEDNSTKFAESWKKGSERAKNFILNNYNAAISGVKNADEQMLTAGEERFEKTLDMYEMELEAREEFNEAYFDYGDEFYDYMLDQSEKYTELQEKKAEDSEKSEERIRNAVSKSMDFVNQSLATFQAYTTLFNVLADSRLAALENEFEKGIISEQEYTQKKKEILLKQAKAEAGSKSADIAINAATAIIRTYAENDWITATIITPLITAAAAASQGVVAKQAQDKINAINQYAEGTNFHPGGMAIVGEEGRELVDLPTGSRVIPNDITEQMLGTMYSINIYINNPMFSKESDMDKLVGKVSNRLGRQMRAAS